MASTVDRRLAELLWTTTEMDFEGGSGREAETNVDDETPLDGSLCKGSGGEEEEEEGGGGGRSRSGCGGRPAAAGGAANCRRWSVFLKKKKKIDMYFCNPYIQSVGL